MLYLKKLAFAPIFLVIFALSCYQLSQILSNYQILFSLDSSSLIQMFIISTLFLLTGVSFILFATFASKWQYILPIILISLLSLIIFIPQPLNLLLSLGFSVAFLISYLKLENTLKTYLNFQPSVLLIPTIKSLTSLLILVSAFGFYLSSSAEIKKNGFSMPDSLIDSVLQAMPMPSLGENTAEKNTNNLSIPGLPQINQEQIDQLKQNPQLLKQYGLDPKVLDSLNSEDFGSNVQTSNLNPIQDSVKDLVKTQLDQTLKPYASFIPAFLGVTLFLTLNWISSILSLFLSPILWVIFEILTKSGFATFTSEMREVKKLVV